ncbi:MAG: glucose/galactose MFS transporter [Bacteroidales bacterium]|nr:glucose/galactose MFS transporter [Bacteroidales bacterium]MBR5055579.1 glucose/galactose MFS transporter [Bacteroidales bacterium]
MFFTVGFAVGINGYFVPFLENNLHLTSAQSYLVVAATFIAFLVFSFPASSIINKIGYKRTMSLAFFLFAVAFALFIPAARMESFALYLFACFVSGTANTILQAAINPYVTILGPIDSAARRISIMGICNSLALSLPSVFIAAVTRKPIESVGLNDLDLPLFIIIGVVVLLGILTFFAPLEEIKAQGEENEEDCPYAAGKKSIWQFPHLILGGLALFVYVGVENLALLTVLDYAKDLGLSNPESYTIWPGIGMAAGYILGIIFIPKYISQVNALRVCTWLAVIMSLGIVLTPPQVSIWFVALLSFACSLMYPAIWPLAIVDLGKFTKKGSSLLVASIGGGALIPVLFGFLKDWAGSQSAYWICLPFYLLIMYYAYFGYKIRK